jgi:uncharacterized protein YpuA (DUF1002 family)
MRDKTRRIKMVKRTYRLFILSLILILGISPMMNTVLGDQMQVVVTLGADLTQDQRNQMLDYMNVNEEDVNLIEVTNKEEAEYLKDTSAADKIGTRAISSAYVEEMNPGEGIKVETQNITWVTADMYKNALATAGVKDARIIAAAPFKVSGTAALTGIFKAFEQIKGVKLDKDAKKVANEEMVTTGELGEELGDQDKASELIKKVKEKIVEEDIKDKEDIKRIIIEIQQDLNIKLDESQIEQITKLMEKINNIDINIGDLKEQVSKLGDKAKEFAQDNEEVKSFLGKILEALNNLIQKITNIFK